MSRQKILVGSPLLRSSRCGHRHLLFTRRPHVTSGGKIMDRLRNLTFEISVIFCLASTTVAAQHSKDMPPIIDVHLHALHANSFGSPTPAVCAGDKDDLAFVPIDPKNGYSLLSTEACSTPMQAPQSDDQLQRGTFDELEKYNITAVTSGSPELVSKWREISPKRIIPGLAFNLEGAPSVDTLRQLYKAGKLSVLGEAMTQYEGISPDDPAWEPYFTLCEELDIPVGIHVGLGAPGASSSARPNIAPASAIPCCWRTCWYATQNCACM